MGNILEQWEEGIEEVQCLSGEGELGAEGEEAVGTDRPNLSNHGNVIRKPATLEAKFF